MSRGKKHRAVHDTMTIVDPNGSTEVVGVVRSVPANQHDYIRLFPKSAGKTIANEREKKYTKAIEQLATALGEIRVLFVEANQPDGGTGVALEAARARIDELSVEKNQLRAERDKLYAEVQELRSMFAYFRRDQ